MADASLPEGPWQPPCTSRSDTHPQEGVLKRWHPGKDTKRGEGHKVADLAPVT